jgi:hypothetical protein
MAVPRAGVKARPWSAGFTWSRLPQKGISEEQDVRQLGFCRHKISELWASQYQL